MHTSKIGVQSFGFKRRRANQDILVKVFAYSRDSVRNSQQRFELRERFERLERRLSATPPNAGQKTPSPWAKIAPRHGADNFLSLN